MEGLKHSKKITSFEIFIYKQTNKQTNKIISKQDEKENQIHKVKALSPSASGIPVSKYLHTPLPLFNCCPSPIFLSILFSFLWFFFLSFSVTLNFSFYLYHFSYTYLHLSIRSFSLLFSCFVFLISFLFHSAILMAPLQPHHISFLITFLYVSPPHCLLH